MAVDRMIWWGNGASPHVSHLLLAIKRGGTRVLRVGDHSMDRGRASIGWRTAPSRWEKLTSGTRGIFTLIKLARSRDVHIFPSIPYRFSKLLIAFLIAIMCRQTIVILAERPNWITPRYKAVKIIRDRFLATLFDRYISVFLAIGSLGVVYYRYVGFSPRSLFNFGYFPDVSCHIDACELIEDTRPFTVLYVGSLVAHKGPDVAIRALARLSFPRPLLNMAGDGPIKPELAKLAESLEVENQVRFLGLVRHDLVPSLIKQADIVVVPSRYDGWGAVTNEALLSGTPVIVSDACGSMDLINNSIAGEVVTAGDDLALAEAIGRRMCAGPLSLIDRANLRSASRSAMSPQAGAAYLKDIIAWLKRGDDEPPPVPPWSEVAS